MEAPSGINLDQAELSGIKVERTSEGDLSQASKEALLRRRKLLELKVDYWVKGINFGVSPERGKYDKVVQELLELDYLLATGEPDQQWVETKELVEEQCTLIYLKCFQGKNHVTMSSVQSESYQSFELDTSTTSVEQEAVLIKEKPKKARPMMAQSLVNQRKQYPSGDKPRQAQSYGVFDSIFNAKGVEGRKLKHSVVTPIEVLLEPVNQPTKVQSVKSKVSKGHSIKVKTTKSSSPTSSMSSSKSSDSRTQISARDIVVPEFDDTVLKWIEFWPIFEAVIHNNSKMSYVERAIRLKKCLTGQAIRWSCNLKFNRESYKQVVDSMCKEFNDPQVQRAAFIEDIKKLPKVINKYENASLRKLWISATQILTQAKQLNLSDHFVNDYVLTKVKTLLPDDMQHSVNAIRPRVESLTKLIQVLYTQIECNDQFKADNPTAKGSSQAKTSEVLPKRITRINAVKTEGTRVCTFCDSPDHRSPRCTLDEQAKEVAVRAKRLCLACLESGHPWFKCSKTELVCIKCQERHWSFMCRIISQQKNKREPRNRTGSAVTTAPIDPSGTTPVNNGAQVRVVLSQEIKADQPISTDVRICHMQQSQYQTCLAKVNGKIVRIGFDSCAGHSFISATLVNRMGLQVFDAPALGIKRHAEKTISSINNQITTFWLTSLDDKFKIKVNVRVIDDLGDMNWSTVSQSVINNLKQRDIQYCDDSSKPIEVMFGLPYYIRIVNGQEIQVTKDLIAKQTKVGWLVFGGSEEQVHSKTLSVRSVTTHDLELAKLYMEMNGDHNETVDVQFNELFKKHYIRHNGQRYVIRFPWITPVKLDRNEELAIGRLYSTLRSLEKNGKFSEYRKTLFEMMELGFADKITKESLGERVYFMPHHAVIREDKDTTKVRIVFDASSSNSKKKRSTEVDSLKSLNENLYKGTTTWNSFEVLLRFRQGKVAASADIEKAYMMIELESEDKDAACFLWKDPGKEISYYRMNRVPFGTSASPYLLFGTLERHFDDFAKQYSVVSIIRNCFYVDDCLPSVDSSKEMIQVYEQSIELMEKAGMNLRKWRSNDCELDKLWANQAKEQVTVLGIVWHLQVDLISPKEVTMSKPIVRTKRDLSSVIASIYDPLGLILPFIVSFKLLLQEVWSEQFEWDEVLPEKVRKQTSKLLVELPLVNQAKVSRWFQGELKDSYILHILCDASNSAIGCVAYVTTLHGGQGVFVHAMSQMVKKQKVGSKDTTPELELKAVAFGVKLYQKLVPILKIKQVVMWSDSTITVSRLTKPINELAAKVTARVWNIKQSIEAQYKWISTKTNVADMLTRGKLVSELLQNVYWWQAPLEIQEYKCTEVPFVNVNVMNVDVIDETVKSLLTSRPSLHQLIDCVKDIEQDKVLSKLIQFSQCLWYSNEMKTVHQKKPMLHKSELRCYPVFVDEQGILRLRTRLTESSQLDECQVYPIVLSPKCGLTWALAVEAHERVGHLATSITLAELRYRYFVPKGRRLVEGVIYNCQVCQTLKKSFMNPSFAPLPQFRVDVPTRAFASMGVDFAGPLQINVEPKAKYYFLIAACDNTRAVDLELCTSVDTESCLQALEAIFARQGVPDRIHSDNGTSFQASRGVFNELFNHLKKAKDHDRIRTYPINWQFQSPYSPWKGGSFERLIQTVKKVLHGMLFKKTIKAQQLNTILHQVSNIVNGRPLFVVDGTVVTPSHFLGGTKKDNFPAIGNGLITECDLVKQFVAQQRRLNGIWKSLLTHYLQFLPTVHKNHTNGQPDIAVGDTVLVPGLNNRREDWPLAKIKHVYSSSDGTPRMVDVEFSNGKVLTRPTARLVHLEQSDSAISPRP